jgi:site-specific DNA recombinase
MQDERNREGDRLVIVYQRVSTDRQDIARQAVQEERARRENPGHRIEVIPDEGVSAFKVPIDRREGGRRLLSLIEARKIEALYVDAQDRVSRGKPAEWIAFAGLCEEAGTRIIIDGREVDPDDMGDGLRGYLEAWLARRESEEKSHRVKGGLRKVVASGRYLGPRRPYGYTLEGRKEERRLLIEPGEARTILRMAGWYEAGAGFREIAARLNEEGIPSPTGIKWERSSVANVLRSPIIAGYVWLRPTPEHPDGQRFDGLHAEIIDRERWERLREIREGRKGKGRRPVGSHAFTGGILRCPECQSALRPRTTPKGYAYYECVCRSSKDRGIVCGQSAINARVLEGKILDGLIGLVFDPEQTRERIDASASEERERAKGMIASAEKRLQAIERKRERPLADYLDGRIDAAEWKRTEAKLDEEEAQAEAHAAELEEAAQAAESEAANIDAEQEVVARLEALQEIIRGDDRDSGSIEVLRQAITATFSRVYLLEDPDGKLMVAPVLRREAVKALGGTRRIETAKHGSHEARTQTPARIPLPASLTKATAGSCSPLSSGSATRAREGT